VLTVLLAHTGHPPTPHDLWTVWSVDPLLLTGSLLAAWAYSRGRTRDRARRTDTWRARCFAAALVAVAVALLSPLDTLASALASAHMVQHLLLILIAAPLLALSAPSSTLLRGIPLTMRRAATQSRRRLHLSARTVRLVSQPGTVWLLHVGTLWIWHAAVLYDAALEHAAVHAVEHASLLVTGVLFWRVVLGARTPSRVTPGFGVLLLFAIALQSTFLSVLLTFARTPWYEGYGTTTAAWGLDPLADQQLAGVIMWVPAGLAYLAVALALLAMWIRGSDEDRNALGTRGW
jgi:putative membrane protein